MANETPIIVTIKLLTIYLEKGTPDDDVIRASSTKLSKVGCLTKNLGGNANNSPIGLNA